MDIDHAEFLVKELNKHNRLEGRAIRSSHTLKVHFNISIIFPLSRTIGADQGCVRGLRTEETFEPTELSSEVPLCLGAKSIAR